MGQGMNILVLKWIHILSAVLILGTGLGSAFYLWRAHKERNLAAIRFALRNVILADWLFTVSPIVLLPVTGVLMMNLKGYAFTDLWLWLSLVCFVVAGLCWMVAYVLQFIMRAMADRVADIDSLPESYWRYQRLWFWLGVAAFPAVIAIFTLMIFKPA